MDSECVCEISMTSLIMTLLDGTSRQVSVELCLLPVPLDAVEGVPHHLIVAHQREVLPHLGLQSPTVARLQDDNPGVRLGESEQDHGQSPHGVAVVEVLG